MADHVVLGNGSFRCLNCGDEFALGTPCGFETFIGAADGFERDHAACRPSDRGRARFEYRTVAEWRRSWDTGESSMSILRFMLYGRAVAGSASVPVDPADFGRCVRLLDVAAREGLGWRERMSEMRAWPAWEPIVDAWGELERLYREELPGGACPKLYARMKELRGEAG